MARRCKILKFLQSNEGIAALEAAIIIPIVFSMLFFLIESIFIQNAITILEAITAETGLTLSSTHSVDTFDTIVSKHHNGKSAMIKNLNYRLVIYDNFTNFFNDKLKGGEEAGIYTSSGDLDGNYYIDSNGNNVKDESTSSIYRGRNPSTITNKKGKIFVLTYSCGYKFSSVFVAKIFSGGSNSKAEKTADVNDGKSFILYSRYVGIFQ